MGGTEQGKYKLQEEEKEADGRKERMGVALESWKLEDRGRGKEKKGKEKEKEKEKQKEKEKGRTD